MLHVEHLDSRKRDHLPFACSAVFSEPKTAVIDKFNECYEDKKYTADAQFILAISQTLSPIRKLFKLRIESELCDIMRDIIRRATDDDKTYQKIMKSFNYFVHRKNGENLLRVYTTDSNLSTILRKENNAYTTLLYLYSKTLKTREFGKSETFRGMGFTDYTGYHQTIDMYRWALQNDNYVLQTRLFQSTSKNIDVAKQFIEMNKIPDQSFFSILCHFHFPEKCRTAVDIEDISRYPVEEEVLICPFTLFKVTNIVLISSDHHIISFTNIPIPQLPLRTAWNNVKNIEKMKN